MSKKQKILAILCLVFILSLTNNLMFGESKVLAQNQTENTVQAKQGTQTQGTPAQKEGSKTQKEGFNPFGWISTTVGWLGGLALGGIFLGISIIIGFIAGILVSLSGAFVNFALNWNYHILENPLITTGWQITRDLANLGFVIFIIIIAIATILRLQEYGAKNTLAKLIAVALLVNFSLFFAGIFIEFSNILTKYFVSNITSGNILQLATALIAPFNPQQFARIKDVGALNVAMQSFGGTLSNIAGSVFNAGFTFLTALCLFAMAVMFLIRFITLSILLILVPLACLFWVLPATKTYWDKWWENFLRWIMFAPAATFFFFLAICLSAKLQTMNSSFASMAQGNGGPPGDQITFANLPTPDFFTSAANFIIIFGFMIGGLIVADKMGIYGAKAAIGATKGAMKGLTGWSGRTTVRTAGYAFSPKGQETMQNWSTQHGIKGVIGKAGLALGRRPAFQKLGQAYRAPGKHKGLWASTWGGMRAGSGLFKKKKQKFKLPSGETIELESVEEKPKEGKTT